MSIWWLCLLEVSARVYYLPGLDGGCSSAHQTSGKSESSVTKTCGTSDRKTLYCTMGDVITMISHFSATCRCQVSLICSDALVDSPWADFPKKTWGGHRDRSIKTVFRRVIFICKLHYSPSHTESESLRHSVLWGQQIDWSIARPNTCLLWNICTRGIHKIVATNQTDLTAGSG